MRVLIVYLISLLLAFSCYAKKYYAYCTNGFTPPEAKSQDYYLTKQCIIIEETKNVGQQWNGGSLAQLKLEGNDTIDIYITIDDMPKFSQYKFKLFANNSVIKTFENMEVSGTSKPKIIGDASISNGNVNDLTTSRSREIVTLDEGKLEIAFRNLKNNDINKFATTLLGLYRYSDNKSSQTSRKYLAKNQ